MATLLLHSDLHKHDHVTAFSDPNLIDVVKEDIDNEIRRLYSYICSLKARRNSLCPVSRLPPEILSEIFLALAEQLQSDRFKTSYKWLSVAHVCRHWRDTAIGHGRLWGRTDVDLPPRTAQFLARSNGAPLAIRQSFTGPLTRISLPAISDPSRRFRELHLKVHGGPIEQGVLNAITSPARMPILESLVLDVFDASSGLVLPAPSEAPRLHRLHLRNIALEWPTCHFPNLTDLVVYHAGEREIPRPSLSDVLDALENMPLLESLSLVDQSILDTAFTSAPNKTVSLPHLTDLHLVGTAFDLTSFASCLSLPTFLKLNLICTDVTRLSDIQTVLKLFSTNLELLDTENDSYLYAYIDISSDKFLLSTTQYSQTEPSRQLGHICFYSRNEAFSQAHSSDICLAMVESLPQKLVRSVCLRNQYTMSPATWEHVLDTISEVRALDVYFDGGINLPHVLASEVAQEGPTVAAKGQFRGANLRILNFSGISFRRRTFHHSHFYESLLACLEKRNSQNQRIEQLGFRSCSEVGSGIAMQFRGLALKLYWDRDFDESSIRAL